MFNKSLYNNYLRDATTIFDIDFLQRFVRFATDPTRLEPILVEHGAVLYLSGHDHDLQHLQSKNGLHYVVPGAGSNVRETWSIGPTVFAASTLGFVHVRATGDDILVRLHGSDSEILHSVRIQGREPDRSRLRRRSSADLV